MSIARTFITGVTPLVLSEFTSGFNITVDISTRAKFWDLYGFSADDVWRGLGLIQSPLQQTTIECI
jgi:Predicted AAA-ATPase